MSLRSMFRDIDIHLSWRATNSFRRIGVAEMKKMILKMILARGNNSMGLDVMFGRKGIWTCAILMSTKNFLLVIRKL